MNRISKITASIYFVILAIQILALMRIFTDDPVVLEESTIPVETLKEHYFDECEEIHIVSYVSDYDTVRRLAILVKSIVMQSHNTLHFHLIAIDDRYKSVVSTLMSSWQLPAVNTVCLTVKECLQTSTDWIDSLEKVIVIDARTTLNGDIVNIWNEFDNFRADQAFGVSTPHKDAGPSGQDQGLILAQIPAVHQETRGKYENLWREVMRQIDQDPRESHNLLSILNKNVRLYYENMTRTLPCNVNIDTRDRLEDCVTDINEVLSFNLADKAAIQDNSSIYQQYFQSVYEAIADHDGNLLRRRYVNCQWLPRASNKTKRCESFVQRESMELRTHMFYYGGYDVDFDDYSVTMAIQADFARFIQMIDMIVTYWPSPMSIAIYASDEEANRLLKIAKFSSALSTRKDIAIHIAYIDRDLEHYPVNHLRNVAQEGVMSNYLFVSEVDFFYSADICQNIRYLISEIDDRERTMDKKAIVVPAFESRILTDRSLPQTKEELVDRYLYKEYSYFHQTKYPGGHKPTNYERWIDATEEYKIRWNRGYEPYLVLATKQSPSFPRIFSGRGFNKGSHTMILVAQGFRLLVSPDTFMIHMPHWQSSSRKQYLDDEHYQKCLSWAKVQFNEKLYKKYNVTERDLRRGGFD